MTDVKLKWHKMYLRIFIERREERGAAPLSQLVGKPLVQSVSGFIFLALAYEGEWSFLYLAISSSHWLRVVNALIIAELAAMIWV